MHKKSVIASIACNFQQTITNVMERTDRTIFLSTIFFSLKSQSLFWLETTGVLAGRYREQPQTVVFQDSHYIY